MKWNSTDENWVLNGNTCTYQDGANVLFGDTGSGEIMLDGLFTPMSVLVENSVGHDYMWGGNGKLSGETSLTKNGEGKLTINTANDYTGGTVLNGGTLVAGNAKAFGTGAIRITGGELDLGGNILAHNLSAENTDVVLRNGILDGDFAVTDGSLDADGVHISASFLNVRRANDVAFRNARDIICDGGTYYIDSAIGAFNSSHVSFTENETVTFSGNESSWGGAIESYDSSDVVFADNKMVIFNGNTASFLGGAFDAQGSDVEFSGNGEVSFLENSASCGGVCMVRSSSTVSFTGNGTVLFNTNTAVYSGGAIDVVYSSTIGIDYNDRVEFCGNSVAGTDSNGGGAICGEAGSGVRLTHNKSVEFIGNSSLSEIGVNMAGGGAIFATGDYEHLTEIALTNNSNVLFSGNYACGSGGGIFGELSAALRLCENETVSFCGNRADYTGGAIAIYADARLDMNGNGSVAFNENYSENDGGAIYSGYPSSCVTISESGSVTFRGNHASTNGGAIFSVSGSTLNLSGNEIVEFHDNYTNGNGGAIWKNGYSYDVSPLISLVSNGRVDFCGNHANALGGAVFLADDCEGEILWADNGSMEFRGNYEQSVGADSASYRLRSVYANSGALKLAAGEGQNITFYDTLYAGSSATLSLNAQYEDKDGLKRDAVGDIVFSGKYAKEDLASLNPNYTEQELADSLTTELYTTTYLYDGRLRVEDGAILKGNGICVETWAGGIPTLRLANGTLDQAGCDIAMATNATLDMVGVNNITASALQMADGTTMQFKMADEQESAILNLAAALQTGAMLVSVDGDFDNEHVLITLADAAQYDISAWTPDKVAVRGTNFAHLVWSAGSLYYRPADISDITLDDDTEGDDKIDEKMSSGESVDIEGNGHSLTVKHPVDLVHLAMKDGVVKLEGEDNNVVRITLTEEGTLQLAAGAGLNVGNIVSMVANGSADLVISGDIEISDIKAYGKPGNKGTLSYVNMTTTGDYTIENMTISGSLIDVGEGTTLYLVNVDIKADTHITDDPAQVFAQGAHAQLDATNTWVDKEITTSKDTTLYLCGDTSKTITLAAGSEIVELTSSMFDSVTLTGTDLWLDMTGIAEFTYNKDYFTLDFHDLAREMTKAQVDVENLHVYATLDGERYTEAYSTASGGLTTTLYFQVPEPSSGTLSLLALAALAARRRRK